MGRVWSWLVRAGKAFWNWDPGGDIEDDLIAAVEQSERAYKRELARHVKAVNDLRDYRAKRGPDV